MLGAFASLGLITGVSAASTFTVNSMVDSVDVNPGNGICSDGAGRCTLRAAMQEANALAGADTITLPSGTYILTIAGRGENVSASGDLDITGNLAIDGAGAASTIIDGGGIDRVLEVHLGATVLIQSVTVRNGNAKPSGESGGGLYNQGTLTVTNSTVTGNSSNSGGGIASENGTVSIVRTTISNNVSSYYGGIWNVGSGAFLTLTHSTVSGNITGSFRGGGIVNVAGHVTLNNSTVSGNISLGEGAGGIWNWQSGSTFTLINTTVSGNTGNEYSGGIRNSGGTLTVVNSTVFGNVDPKSLGAGINNDNGGTTILKNTIVAKNRGVLNISSDCSGVITSLNNNIASDNSCGLNGSGDRNSIDPLLGPLAANGGPTQTHAPLLGSPAINAVPLADCTYTNANPITTDQRGVARPLGAACEIGSVEFDPDAVAPTASPTQSPAANGAGWNNSDVTVTWSWADNVGGSGIDPANCTISSLSSGQGTLPLNATCKDVAGNTGNAALTVKVDKTSPTITISAVKADSTPYSSGTWTNQTVTVRFTCTDTGGSGIATCPADQTFSVDGATSLNGTTTDIAGNSASSSFILVRIDKTAPAAGAIRTPAANANGWNNTDVLVSFACSDALSGVAVAAASSQLTTEGAGQSRSFTCQDLAGNTAMAAVIGINIDKTKPVVNSVAATPNPAPVNTPISLAASLTDSGSSNLALAEHRIDGGPYSALGAASGASATTTGSLGSFLSPAVLNACVRATDIAGNQSTEECVMIAVYDVSAGFVTGAGTLQSPVGALVGSPASGRAQFAFQSKYKQGATVPSGNTQFKFKAGNFEFDSTEYEWLVIAGARAQYKGDGVIKGQAGTFKFLLTAIDGSLPGGGGEDKLRLKITGPSGGLVYDNQIGASDGADPSTAIDGGNIVINK